MPQDIPAIHACLDALAMGLKHAPNHIEEHWLEPTDHQISLPAADGADELEPLVRALETLDETLLIPNEHRRVEFGGLALIAALGLEDRVATLFLTPEALHRAVGKQGLLNGDGWNQVFDDLEAGRAIAIAWEEPAFALGRGYVASLADILNPAFVRPQSTITPPPLLTRDRLRHLITIQENGQVPRVEALLPFPAVQDDEASTRPALAAMATLTAAHCLGALAMEIREGGDLRFSSDQRSKGTLTDEGSLSLSTLGEFQRLIFWIHKDAAFLEERHSTANRELRERLGYLHDADEGLLARALRLGTHLRDEAEQVFAAFQEDKLNDFFKAQGDLVKEVKDLTTSHAEKTRALVAGLARDALAGTILTALVSLRILGTSTSAQALPEEVLWVIAGLVGGVGAIQLLFATLDYHSTTADFTAWLNRSLFLVSGRDRLDLVDNPMKRRRRQFWSVLIVVGLCYGILSFGIVFFKNITGLSATAAVSDTTPQPQPPKPPPEAETEHDQTPPTPGDAGQATGG